MFWTVYEIILNIYQGALFTWFITKMLPKKKPEYLSSLACSLLTATALSLYLFLSLPEWDTWIFFFVILYALFFFDGSILQKMFWCSILIIISMGIIGIYYEFFSIVTGADTEKLLSTGSIRILFTVSSNTFIWLGLWLTTRCFPEKSHSVKPLYLLLFEVLLCSFQVDIYFKLKNRYEIPLVWLFVGSLISIAIAIITLINYRLLEKHEREKQVLQLQDEMLKEAYSQTEDLQQVYGSMLQLRHDMRSYVHDIQEMVNNGKLPKEPEYLKDLESQVLPLYSSGNQTLDSVLAVKLNKLRANRIELRGTNLHYTGGMNISDFELCSLISNMIDNAIEALNERKHRDGDRYVYLQFTYSPAGLTIICENPLLGIPPKMQRSSFLSNKYEPYHGLGISIMKRIVDKASGTFEVAVTDDLFRVLVIIPPKDLSSTEDRKVISDDTNSKTH